jgi:hypothetical protein
MVPVTAVPLLSAKRKVLVVMDEDVIALEKVAITEEFTATEVAPSVGVVVVTVGAVVELVVKDQVLLVPIWLPSVSFANPEIKAVYLVFASKFAVGVKLAVLLAPV